MIYETVINVVFGKSFYVNVKDRPRIQLYITSYDWFTFNNKWYRNPVSVYLYYSEALEPSEGLGI